MAEDNSPPLSLSRGAVAVPKGRWAQRAERNKTPKPFYSESETNDDLNETLVAETQVQHLDSRRDTSIVSN